MVISLACMKDWLDYLRRQPSQVLCTNTQVGDGGTGQRLCTAGVDLCRCERPNGKLHRRNIGEENQKNRQADDVISILSTFSSLCFSFRHHENNGGPVIGRKNRIKHVKPCVGLPIAPARLLMLARRAHFARKAPPDNVCNCYQVSGPCALDCSY